MQQERIEAQVAAAEQSAMHMSQLSEASAGSLELEDQLKRVLHEKTASLEAELDHARTALGESRVWEKKHQALEESSAERAREALSALGEAQGMIRDLEQEVHSLHRLDIPMRPSGTEPPPSSPSPPTSPSQESVGEEPPVDTPRSPKRAAREAKKAAIRLAWEEEREAGEAAASLLGLHAFAQPRVDPLDAAFEAHYVDAVPENKAAAATVTTSPPAPALEAAPEVQGVCLDRQQSAVLAVMRELDLDSDDAVGKVSMATVQSIYSTYIHIW